MTSFPYTELGIRVWKQNEKRPRGFLPCNPASEIVSCIEADDRLRIAGMGVDGGKAGSSVSFFNVQSKDGRIVSVLTQSGKTLMMKFADDCLGIIGHNSNDLIRRW